MTTREMGTTLTVASAAQHLGITEKALRGLVARRRVPFRRLGRRVLFLRSELDQFVERLPGVHLGEARGEASR